MGKRPGRDITGKWLHSGGTVHWVVSLCWLWKVYFFEFLKQAYAWYNFYSSNSRTNFYLWSPLLPCPNLPAQPFYLHVLLQTPPCFIFSVPSHLKPMHTFFYASSYPFTPEFPSPLFVLMHGWPLVKETDSDTDSFCFSVSPLVWSVKPYENATVIPCEEGDFSICVQANAVAPL